jgi:hypothetical protein
MMKTIKAIFICVCVVLVSTQAYSDSQFFVFGKGNFFAASGTDSDYEVGVNEFPVASAYQNYGAGFGLTFGKIIFAGIEGHYNLSGKVTLTDTSDDDTVEVNTYKYASGIFTLGVNVVRSRSIRLYINGGGGVRYNLDSESQTYFSEYGYETMIDPPEKKYLLEAFGGVGIELYLSQSSGLLFSGRYSYVDLDDPQTSFIVLVGIVYRF